MIDQESVDTIAAAVRHLDPETSVDGYLSQRLVRITAAAPAQRLIEAMEAAGFVAEPSDRPQPAPPAFTAGAIGRVIGRAVLWALAWSLLLPLLTLMLVGTITFMDPQCGGPGDSGGCAMGIATITFSAVPLGTLLGLIVTLLRGLWKIHRAKRAHAP